MEREQISIDLWITPEQKKRWEKIADIMCLSLYEYIRKCTNAHTTILENDQFDLVHEKSLTKSKK